MIPIANSSMLANMHALLFHLFSMFFDKNASWKCFGVVQLICSEYLYRFYCR